VAWCAGIVFVSAIAAAGLFRAKTRG
jgi:hypothetical protein